LSLFGTKLSTAAPPLVITLTICYSVFVFFIPLVTSFFLSSAEESFLLGAFGGLGAFLGGETSFFAFDWTALAGVTFLAGDTFLFEVVFLEGVMALGSSFFALEVALEFLGGEEGCLESEVVTVFCFFYWALSSLALVLAGIKKVY